MNEKKITRKYVFTVEGETEAWYLQWLQEIINGSGQADCKVSITATVQQRPYKYAKVRNSLSTPSITHICDVESNEEVHKQKFMNILEQLKDANKNR